MSNETIVRHCAPTLAGLKTGSMFSYYLSEDEDLNRELRKINRMMVKYGLRMLPLAVEGNRVLLYLYRPDYLEHDMMNSHAEELLLKCGYIGESTGKRIGHLIKKIKYGEEFPHEIGLFLGYPPEDVEGFMENRAGGYKFSGFWKVYGDVDVAKRRFQNYRNCSSYLMKKLEEGTSLEDLVVA